jgi:hypothetical protein
VCFIFYKFCFCITGIVVNMIVNILELSGLLNLSFSTAATTMRTLFGLLLPHSALSSALSHFGSTATHNAQCRNMPASIKNYLCGTGLQGSYSVACCGELNFVQTDVFNLP